MIELECCGRLKKSYKKVFLMKATLWLVLIVALFGGCQYINKKIGLPNDNVFEEAIEDVIEAKTGLDIDLTPGDD